MKNIFERINLALYKNDNWAKFFVILSLLIIIPLVFGMLFLTLPFMGAKTVLNYFKRTMYKWLEYCLDLAHFHIATSDEIEKIKDALSKFPDNESN